ncbi:MULTISPECIES: NAD(P)/FAD-dependent oxidoreductase [unclassified Paracoccus (in: a-proteobacteria)]|uniref:NAD(P)/FAD-dependent oxidoreductase n=1 Tax=unclassified Paracoccus (in: a-proteobacteria) TaxID=2688777 RepID=UPI0015FF21DB|nr:MULTISPECIES: NAD(P)/FAD-dependent oxidoreductase [unclassified Paracoccus (in: a-proteobacteria)]MBB1490226.1 NAD(P)/FAD-dependent oxidoreductase [Paracoccus sp. MC1854]MBB1498487.1 NAD(P)/FAD-dependent oxidoreductase [Paracoccus sp. MC1862]QQO43837.1 NAD(P)/FAD-dependent oxidoreductase [Paracoccus sp. MC1862]
MDRVGCIVVGAGVVGLAIARALALRGVEVVIAEKAEAIGTETSSRNSEVIHAGIYYAPGSLKARLCAQGRGILYDYAAAKNVPHRRCGKLIVATSPEQLAVLEGIAGHAASNGVELTLISGAAAMALEPALSCHGALLSPETGIVDSHALMAALLADTEAAGAHLALGTCVTGIEAGQRGFIVETEAAGERFTLAADAVVNAAGLWASQVAQAVQGLDPAHVPVTRYARGSYYAVPGRPAFSRLIYPVPEPGGLGVHLTLDLGGAMRFGPDVEWIDGIDYRVNPGRQAHFESEIRRYWPGLPEGALAPTYCGIRPKISGPGEPAADFRIDGPEAHGIVGLVNLFGIESPGLTSSLAIAEEVAARLDQTPASAAT